jgi:hypothetical protein
MHTTFWSENLREENTSEIRDRIVDRIKLDFKD